MASPDKGALNARLRADQRVIAALRARGGRLSAAELAQLGYAVPQDWTLAGNPTQRSGRTDYENTAALVSGSKLELIPKIGGPAILGLGVGSLAAGGAAAATSAAPSAAAGFGGPVATTSVPTGLGFGGLSASQAAGYGSAAQAAGRFSGAGDFLGAKPSVMSRVGNGLADGAMNGWQQAAIAALAGIPGLLASKQGPSDEEKALMDQMRRQGVQQEQMQAQQMQRTTHQNPLFQAVSQLAMSRLPAGVQAPMPPMGEM